MQKYTLKSENIKNWIIKSCCAIDIYFYIYIFNKTMKKVANLHPLVSLHHLL